MSGGYGTIGIKRAFEAGGGEAAYNPPQMKRQRVMPKHLPCPKCHAPTQVNLTRKETSSWFNKWVTKCEACKFFGEVPGAAEAPEGQQQQAVADFGWRPSAPATAVPAPPPPLAQAAAAAAGGDGVLAILKRLEEKIDKMAGELDLFKNAMTG